MKNEVKKKMMIDSRKLWHQSHDERIFPTNVNLFLQEAIARFGVVTLLIGSSRASTDRTTRKNLESRNRDAPAALVRV